MRLILTGCEYSGKTTLADALEKWGEEKGFHFHMDDHFQIPQDFHLNDAERKALWEMTPTLKERYQRFQIHYHVDVISKYDHCILVGFHFEEMVYGPRYYYPKTHGSEYVRIETQLPDDTIVVLMTAQPDEIRARMKRSPHQYQLVMAEQVEEVQTDFQKVFNSQFLLRRFKFDTTGLKPDELLGRFLIAVRPYMNAKDLLVLGG